MNKKAKVAIFAVLFVVALTLIFLVPFMGKAQETQIAYNNIYETTPSEIKNKIPLDVAKDDSWQVEWHETQADLTHREYVIAVQNQKDASSQFDLSVLFDNMNFDASQVSNINLYEWKEVTKYVPRYELTEACDYPETYDEETNKSNGNLTNCWQESVQVGSDEVNALEWTKAGDLSEQVNGNAKKAAYGAVSFDALGSAVKEGSEKGVKYFKLAFDVPIVQTGNGWGSSGRVAFVEGNSGKEYHPWWNASWAYRTCFNATNNQVKASGNVTLNRTLNAASLTAAGKMQEDYDDLRVANLSGTVFEYNYTLNATSGDLMIYANYSKNWTVGETQTFCFYYGNPSAVNAAVNLDIGTKEDYNANSPTPFNAFGRTGMKITIGGDDVKLMSIRKISAVTATTAYVATSHTGGDLASAAFVGDVATFSPGYDLTAGSTYYLLVGPSPSFYSTYEAFSAYPIPGSNLNWIGCVNQEGNDGTDYKRSILNAVVIPLPTPTYSEFALEESTNGTTESEGDTAIQQGIENSTINPPTVDTDQQIYVRNVAGQQQWAKFDVVAAKGNQRWAFNYVTNGDPTSDFTYMANITPVFYVWESSGMNKSAIYESVKAFIDNTKQDI